MGPRQEIVDLAVMVTVDDPDQHVGEVAERLDVVELAGLCRPPNYAERHRRAAAIPMQSSVDDGWHST